MNSVFGKTGDFAIEAVFEYASERHAFGRLIFWCGETVIGDYENTTDLAASARWGRVFLAASARRSRRDLDNRNSLEVFEEVYGRFVGGHGRSRGEQGRWDRDPYVLDEVGESSLRDHWAVIVVRRGDGQDRLLVKSFDEDSLVEVRLAPAECDAVIEEYCAWVERAVLPLLSLT